MPREPPVIRATLFERERETGMGFSFQLLVYSCKCYGSGSSPQSSQGTIIARGGNTMRKVLWASLFVVTLLTALPTYAQNPNYDVGPVWRVVYYQIKPGQGEA